MSCFADFIEGVIQLSLVPRNHARHSADRARELGNLERRRFCGLIKIVVARYAKSVTALEECWFEKNARADRTVQKVVGFRFVHFVHVDANFKSHDCFIKAATTTKRRNDDKFSKNFFF
jgi:hypothetical protein